MSQNTSWGDIRIQPLDEIINSKPAKEMRMAIMRGEQHPQCSKCFEYEKIAPDSRRQFTKNYIKHNQEVLDHTSDDGTIDMDYYKMQYWDFRFSNICNFGCRMCGPDASSRISIEQNGTAKHVIKFDDKKNDTWQNIIKNNLKDVKQIQFAGGEPMLMKEHWLALDLLMDQKMFDVQLRYNTNMSTLVNGGKNAITYWEKFSDVVVNSSIDDIGPRAEYSRYGTRWEDVVQNLKTVHGHFGRILPISVCNILTIFYIDELVEFFNSTFTDVRFTFIFCRYPKHFSPSILPKELKMIVAKKLQAIIDNKDKYKNVKSLSRLQSVISQMMTDDPNVLLHRRTFIEKTSQLDNLRGQNFDSTFSEIAPYIRNSRFLTDINY